MSTHQEPAKPQAAAGTGGADSLALIEASTENNKFVELIPSVIRSEDQLKQVLADKAAAGPISQGQIITTEQWVEVAELQTIRLSELIEPGSVAISLRPDEIAGVGGFVRAGDRVNIIASTAANLDNTKKILSDPIAREIFFPGLVRRLGIDQFEEEQIVAFFEALPTGFEYTASVMQEVDVLAVGPEVRETGADSGLIPAGTQIFTLEVSATDAEKVAYLHQYLAFHLALLPEDYQPETTPGVSLEDLFGFDRLLPILEVGGG